MCQLLVGQDTMTYRCWPDTVEKHGRGSVTRPSARPEKTRKQGSSANKHANAHSGQNTRTKALAGKYNIK